MANATSTGLLSYAQLKAVWLQAAKGTGYDSNTWASLMAAIAEAESSGDPTATNPYDNDGTQTSWGLWQISLGNHEPPSPNWADPTTNAQLAIGKLNGQGLSAWGTYDSGAYKAFLSDKTAADLTSIPTGPDAASQGALTAAATQSATCAWGIGSPVPNPSILGYHPLGSFQGQICILSKPQARGLIGAWLLIGGGLIIAAGLAMILKASAVTQLAGVASVASKVAGPVAAVAGPEAGVAAAATSAARPRQGTRADSTGTSPEFRSAFL
jgi:hypothetical protein